MRELTKEQLDALCRSGMLYELESRGLVSVPADYTPPLKTKE